MKPTTQQLATLGGVAGRDDALAELEFGPSFASMLSLAVQPTWPIAVQVKRSLTNRLAFEVSSTEDRAKALLALVHPEHPHELVRAALAPSLLAQARTAECATSIEEDFELAGITVPAKSGPWRRPAAPVFGNNTALGGSCEVVATDGQLALALWHGGRSTGLIELANVEVDESCLDEDFQPYKCRSSKKTKESDDAPKRDRAAKALSIEFV